MVLAVIIRLLMREPPRKELLSQAILVGKPPGTRSVGVRNIGAKYSDARTQLIAAVKQVVSMKSFWVLALSSGARQFSGNVFGWYMPSYLSWLYPSETELLSRYGIIVGVVGSFAVLLGGLICSSMPKRPTVALYVTGIGGIISSAFVVCMVFSLKLAGGNREAGVRILYGVMCAAYLTAELWLGAFASLLAILLPVRTKTFCLAIYTSTIILIYSSAPQMIGLALRNYDPGSPAYIEKTRNILAILIPIGYCVAGIGFLFGVRKVNQDIRLGQQVDIHGVGHDPRRVSFLRKAAFSSFVLVLLSLTISLFVTSLTID